MESATFESLVSDSGIAAATDPPGDPTGAAFPESTTLTGEAIAANGTMVSTELPGGLFALMAIIGGGSDMRSVAGRVTVCAKALPARPKKVRAIMAGNGTIVPKANDLGAFIALVFVLETRLMFFCGHFQVYGHFSSEPVERGQFIQSGTI